MTFETEIAERSLRADELVREGRAQLPPVGPGRPPVGLASDGSPHSPTAANWRSVAF